MVTKETRKKGGAKLKRPKKKAVPYFNVLNYGFMKSVPSRWRKPRGTANKKRRKNKWAGALPKIGYRNADAVRGMRKDGRREVLVRGLPDLERVKLMSEAERATVALMFASSLSKRTRAKMAETAKQLNVKMLNFKVV
ncbi:MAG: eL32 family ribosomal protein [Candidatus Micrarchaeota archaeon]